MLTYIPATAAQALFCLGRALLLFRRKTSRRKKKKKEIWTWTVYAFSFYCLSSVECGEVINVSISLFSFMNGLPRHLPWIFYVSFSLENENENANANWSLKLNGNGNASSCASLHFSSANERSFFSF
jgi:hypothetical protein